MLNFEVGESQKPRGHALLYFRAWADQDAVFATYLIVPPIAVEISKYIPPMFASQFQGMGGIGGIGVFPYPPIPERVESQAHLLRLAQARGDDLLFGGAVDASSPDRLLRAATEAAQEYFSTYSTFVATLPTEPAPEALPEEGASLEVSEVMYGLMSERDRLGELTKLSGQLRYAVSGNDASLVSDIGNEIRRLGRFLPEKYRVDETIRAASRPGVDGDRLTQLLLDRAYKLVNEDYEGLQDMEAEIRRLAGNH